MRFLLAYVHHVFPPELESVAAETPLFCSSWGLQSVGKICRPMTGKNIRRMSKVYGWQIAAPTLKPHYLRHGVALEVVEGRNDLEELRALLSHARIDTTKIYTTIRPSQLKRATAF
jgi:site-specific recombinase XerD